MFRKSIAVSLCLISAFSASICFYLIPIGSNDVAAYRNLMEESRAIHTKLKWKSQSIEQRRFELQKEIWIDHRNRPIHLCMKSPESLLIYRPRSDFLEHFQHFESWVSEDKSSYHLISDEACYRKGQFEVCHRVNIDYPEGKICAEKAVFTKKGVSLENQVNWADASFLLKESFVLADQLFYFFDQQQIVLKALSPHRVLFWQEGLSLSAPEIQMDGKEKSAKGIGDVHFYFDLEEKDSMKKLMENLL